VNDLTGLWFDPFRVCWNFSQNLDVNYFISAEKPNNRD
jgi:2-polyprenyl-3-methyl-5-hydroxy-6-metoxy-1,4-benzoquinol methylase